MAIRFSGGIQLPQGRLEFKVPVDAPIPSSSLPQLSNVLFHLDPSDASSVTLTGSDIDQIDDQTSNDRNFVDEANKPVYVISAQNGLNVMDFSTATTGAGTTRMVLNTALTIKHVFIVAKHDATTFPDFDGLFSTIQGGGNSILVGSNGSASWFPSAFPLSPYYENLTNRSNGVTTTLSSWTVHSISLNSGLARSTWRIGHDAGFSNRNWEGQIGDVVIYDVVLGSTDRDQLITDLMTKWAIT